MTNDYECRHMRFVVAGGRPTFPSRAGMSRCAGGSQLADCPLHLYYRAVTGSDCCKKLAVILGSAPFKNSSLAC